MHDFKKQLLEAQAGLLQMVAERCSNRIKPDHRFSFVLTSIDPNQGTVDPWKKTWQRCFLLLGRRRSLNQLSAYLARQAANIYTMDLQILRATPRKVIYQLAILYKRDLPMPMPGNDPQQMPDLHPKLPLPPGYSTLPNQKFDVNWELTAVEYYRQAQEGFLQDRS